MKKALMKWPLIGVTVGAAAAVAAGGVAAAGAFPAKSSPTPQNLTLAGATLSCPVGHPGAADRAALGWVTGHASGGGQASVIKTEADVEQGQCVFDVRTLAPDGTIWVVHVSRSSVAANETVLSASLAERSAPTSPETSPSAVASPTITAKDIPQPTEAPQPQESPKATETPQPQETPKPSQSPAGSDN